MTDEERKALVERLRDITFRADFPAGHVITSDNLALSDVDDAATQIEADGQRIAELEAQVIQLQVDSEPSPYCPICGSCGDEGCCGEKRCQYPDTGLLERIAELEAVLREFVDAARYDPHMGGTSTFMGWNQGQLRRAETQARAALETKP